MGSDGPTERAIERVRASMPGRTRSDVLAYIAAANRGNLICPDCGSENHTRGHELCRWRECRQVVRNETNRFLKICARHPDDPIHDPATWGGHTFESAAPRTFTRRPPSVSPDAP